MQLRFNYKSIELTDSMDNVLTDAYFHLPSRPAQEMGKCCIPYMTRMTQHGRRHHSARNLPFLRHPRGQLMQFFFFSREIAASVTHVATGRDTGILLYSDRSPISHKDHTVGSKTRECSILCPNDFFVRFGKCSHDGKEEKQGTCHGGQQPQRNRRQWHRWQRRDLQVYKDQPSKISYGKGDREEVIIKDWL